MFCEGGIQCDPNKEPPSEQNCNLMPCPSDAPASGTTLSDIQTTLSDGKEKGSHSQSSNVPTLIDKLHTDTVYKETTTEQSLAINPVLTDKPLAKKESPLESSRTTVPYDEKTVDAHDYSNIETTATVGDVDNAPSGFEDKDNETSETTFESASDILNEITDYEHVTEGGTDEKPTTSNDIEETVIQDKTDTQNKTSSIENDKNNKLKGEYENIVISKEENDNAELKPDVHKHRHHHGDNLGVIEETNVQERNPNQDEKDINIQLSNSDSSVIEIKDNSTENKIILETENTADEKSSDSTSAGSSVITTKSSLNVQIKATSTDRTVTQDYSNKDVTEMHDEDEYILPDKTNNLPLPSNSNKPTIPDLKDLPELDKMPPLPDIDKLPPLPDKDLPPLPDINKLPPLSSKEMPPLPNMDKLSPLPDKDLQLPVLPDLDNLPHLADKDLPPLPDKDKLSPLPDEGTPPLTSLDKIPDDPNTHKTPPLAEREKVSPSEGLAPLHNPDNFPVLQDKDLPPLPDTDMLAPLPDLGQLPPLPDLPHLPDKNKLSPLPDSKTGVENIGLGSEPESKDIILNTNTNSDHSDKKLTLNNAENHDALLKEEETDNSKLNISDISLETNIHDPYDLVKTWNTELEERNYTWVSSEWSEVGTSIIFSHFMLNLLIMGNGYTFKESNAIISAFAPF